MSTDTPSAKPALAQMALTFLSSRAGVTFLLTLWPVILALLGLPTGAAEEALRIYRGETTTPAATTECSPCPACPTTVTSATVGETVEATDSTP
jgi:hypothetical protein